MVYTSSELSALIRPLLDKYGMARAFLFGSYAQGNATETSDIDIIVEGKPGFRALDVFGVGEELRRASGKSVDIYELSELDDGPFKEAVFSYAVTL